MKLEPTEQQEALAKMLKVGSLPIVKAWRAGHGRIAVLCPRCGDVHCHGDVTIGEDSGTRMSHCSREHRPYRYRPLVQSGRMPEHVKALYLRVDRTSIDARRITPNFRRTAARARLNDET